MVDLEVVGGNAPEVREKIIVAVAGEDTILNYEHFGLNFDSTDHQVLSAIRGFIQEKHGVDLQTAGGDWLYKTRKAVTSRNIYVIPNSTAGVATQPVLEQLSNKERLDIYDTLIQGCMHLWSKNKLQESKMSEILAKFSVLAEQDPLFLAHFTSYAFKKLDTKDLKVVACFISSLSDADGTPFVAGGEYKKPNFRLIASAAFQELDPKLALRVLKLANSKRKLGTKIEGTHFSKHLKTAARKYLRYREANPKALYGIKKAGLGNTLMSMYRIARLSPSPEACAILRWKQKPGFPGANVKINKSMFDFKNKTDLQIAETIRDQKLKPQAVLGALPDKISPVIAIALLEQCSGDQAVVLTSLFEDQGLLKHKEVREVYDKKLRKAKTALDRVERIKQELDEDTKKVLRNAKADVRKEQVGDIGKVFLHIDISGSMQSAIEIAKDKGAIIAECVKNPQQNFHWGVFNSNGGILPTPEKFTKDAFMSKLYSVRAGGGTNCLALFQRARELGCDTDVYITDGGHTDGDIQVMLRQMKARGIAYPKQVVIIKCGGYNTVLENGLKAEGIQVATIAESQLSESALVTQAINMAAKGAVALIDEIMGTSLLGLPKWYESVG
jgi:hypothetical protein